MNTVYITASVVNGEIVAVSNSEPTAINEGFAVLSKVIHDGAHFVPDHLSQKVDWDADDVVEMLPWEMAAARAPKSHELRIAIASELAATDQYLAPDRPGTAAKRAAWETYRQALRDLSKLDGPGAMVKAWPERPSGPDPISALRARI
jgi:hypothetical protein